jgi:hypothetical protein
VQRFGPGGVDDFSESFNTNCLSSVTETYVMLRPILFLTFVAALAAISAPAKGDIAIQVPDYSFEVPDASAAPYYVAYPATPPAEGGWAKGSDSPYAWPSYALRNNGNYGTPPVISGVDGNQFGWLAYGKYGNQNGTYQDLSARYGVGGDYTLTVGVARGSSLENDTLEIGLLWKSDDKSTSGVVGSVIATGGDLSTTAMTDYTFTVSNIVAGSDAAGKHVGIYFKTAGGGGNDVDFAVDNVRLTTTYTPEPSGLVLVVSALVGLLAYAWRKRR